MFYRYYILKKRYSEIGEDDKLKTEVFNQVNIDYIYLYIVFVVVQFGLYYESRCLDKFLINFIGFEKLLFGIFLLKMVNSFPVTFHK